jgi:hypothetical protein
VSDYKGASKHEQGHYLMSPWWVFLTELAQEKFDNLLSTYSTLLNELAPWRLQVIQAGEEASESSFSIWIITAYTITPSISTGTISADAKVAQGHNECSKTPSRRGSREAAGMF